MGEGQDGRGQKSTAGSKCYNGKGLWQVFNATSKIVGLHREFLVALGCIHSVHLKEINTLKLLSPVSILTLLCLHVSAIAADQRLGDCGFPAYDPNFGWGLIDENGNWISQARYDAVSPCSCGVAFAAVTTSLGGGEHHPAPHLIWSPMEWLPGDVFTSPTRLVAEHSQISRRVWLDRRPSGTGFGSRPTGIFALVDSQGTELGRFEAFRSLRNLPDCGPVLLRDDLVLEAKTGNLPIGITDVRRINSQLFVYEIGGRSGLLDSNYNQITPASFGRLVSFAPGIDGNPGIFVFGMDTGDVGDPDLQFVTENGTEILSSSAHRSSIVRGAPGPLLVAKLEKDFSKTVLVNPETEDEVQIGAHWPAISGDGSIVWRGDNEELFKGKIVMGPMKIAGSQLLRSDVTWLWPDVSCSRIMFSTESGIGFMDTQGNTVVEPTLERAGGYINNLAGVVTKSHKYQVINAEGEAIYTAELDNPD